MSNILKYGPGNVITRNLVGQTIGQIIDDRNLQSVLGYGTNVQARISGRVVDRNYAVRDGDTIDLETVANRKAADVIVTITYGPGNKLTRSFPQGTTVGQIISNPNLKSCLGYGDNVRATVEGAVVRDDLAVTEGLSISLETAANQKAA